MSGVNLVKHPLIDHSLAILRNERTPMAEFRQHAGIISTVLLIEATRDLATEKIHIQTPLAATVGAQLQTGVVVVPVLRAGLAMMIAAQGLLINTPVGFLGLERDEKTAVAREYYQKFPAVLDGYKALILDPMLATGGSLAETISAVQKRGNVDITLVCVVAAPEGIERVLQAHPNVKLYTASIDSHLNDSKFIVPGLGDFGDRYFGT